MACVIDGIIITESCRECLTFFCVANLYFTIYAISIVSVFLDFRYQHHYIDRLSETQKISKAECLAQLKKIYDGYCFHPNGVAVYNSYSLLSTFLRKSLALTGLKPEHQHSW